MARCDPKSQKIIAPVLDLATKELDMQYDQQISKQDGCAKEQRLRDLSTHLCTEGALCQRFLQGMMNQSEFSGPRDHLTEELHVGQALDGEFH